MKIDYTLFYNSGKIILGINILIAAFFQLIKDVFSPVDIQLLTYVNIFQNAIIFLYCLQVGKGEKRFAFLVFNIAYFILMLGSYICNIDNLSFYGWHHFRNWVELFYCNEYKGLLYILLSQYIIFLVYSWRDGVNQSDGGFVRDEKIKLLAKISTFFMIIGGLAAFTKLFLKIAYVQMNGYLSIYLANGNALYQNSILDIFDKFYLLGFYGLLATAPAWKEIRWSLEFYVLFSVLSLFTGVRGDIVVNALFLIYYFCKRYSILKIGPKVFSVKNSIIGIIISFMSFYILYMVGRSRVGASGVTGGLIEKVIAFIDGQGYSGKLIALGLQYREEMLVYISPFMMIFAPIRSFLVNNSLVRTFTGGSLGQTIENLTISGGFADVITYVTNPESYLGGAGLGTSYVAETVVAYGAIGLAVFSCCLGFFLHYLDNLNFNKWIFTVILINLFNTIIYIPRHATLGLIPESVSAVVFICIVWFIIKVRMKGICK